MKLQSIFVLLGLLLSGLLFVSAVNQKSGYNVGDKARDFSLKNVDGKMVSLAGLPKAKGAIIIFSCNHCPYVVKYEDRMVALGKKYASKGYPVIAINSNDVTQYPDDSFEKMVERHKKKKYSFAYVFDETQEIAKAYGAEKTPHVYVVNKEGADFVVKYIGAIDDNPNDSKAVKERYVENAVDALLSGKEVPVKSTKAIGCGIKWKK